MHRPPAVHVQGGGRNASLRRASVVLTSVALGAADKVAALLDFNLLEKVLLSCSCSILMAGMIFQSAQFAEGSATYTGFTVLVFLVFFGAVGLFVRLVAVEVRRTCGGKSSSGGSRYAPVRGDEWTTNPMRKESKEVAPAAASPSGQLCKE